jgi:hypothetical protein
LPDGAGCYDPMECCSLVCDEGICGGNQCKLDGYPCGAPDECCSGQCTDSVCGTGGCLPLGSTCQSSPQCCDPLVCSGNHCGNLLDGGNCSLDPGGTPCSQCIVLNCCAQTETCLSSGTCATAMGCFQGCVLDGTSPAQCQTQCCGNSGQCTAWTSCVTGACTAQCY